MVLLLNDSLGQSENCLLLSGVETGVNSAQMDGDAWAATHWPRVCTDILHFPQKTLLLMLMHHYITNTNQLEKLEAAKAA